MEATGSSYKRNNSIPKMTLKEQSIEREKKEFNFPVENLFFLDKIIVVTTHS